ncbi:hypothetical protein RCO27_00650 [Sphingosinicella sp. LHD-64]|uniref:DUF3108 domain-containing protein n=1 Tax=Sphingosinicella sp. LHD-64 TaxID=3072139 RepID=UPI00280F5EF9|nr:hypothetical protein [Sphingosinicella sp. LHD-64]MDQ8754727.1 hypothetical protein [Sphingosinicella sp. LHD-64]
MRYPTVLIGLVLVASAMAIRPILAQDSAAAEGEAIRVGQPLPRFDRLRPGTSRYLRYAVRADRRTIIDIWTRTIAFESDSATGTRRLHITQVWEGSQSERRLDSWFEMGTFRPLSHRTSLNNATTANVAGVLFTPERVRGDGSVTANSLAALDVATPAGTFNFETDMEMMSTLPWREGYATRINFYHPGGGAPQDHVVRVTGSEPVMLGGRPVDCWVVTLDYGRGATGRFWIAKDSQTVLKVEQRTPGQPTLYKVLLPSEGSAAGAT